MIHPPGRKYFSGENVYTDWVSRGGENVFIRAETIAASDTTSPTVTIKVFTKNSEDSSDQGVEVFESTAGDLKLDLTSATGVKQLAVLQKKISAGGQGLLEQVRLKITTSGNEGDRNWLLARIFAPIFFETANSA